MEDPKQPYHYTAGDLERYISGQMSRDEMHRLEKTALDDPFLAEALEGMMLSGGDEAWKDLGELKENLRIRIEGPQETSGLGAESNTASAGHSDDNEPGVFPMRPSIDAGAPAPRIGWRNWRVAAAVGLLIGLGLLTTWLIQRPWNAEKTIASRSTTPAETDTTAATPAAGNAEAPSATATDTTAVAAAREAVTASQPSPSATIASASDRNDSAFAAIAAAPAPQPAEQPETAVLKAGPPLAKSEQKPGDAVIGPASENRARTVPAITGKITGPYVYSGQVHDPEGQPLSFVNIRLEPAGTSQYTDARGQFRILSADSALTMHLRAYGYTNKAAQLQAGKEARPVTLTMQPGKDREKAIAARKPKASSKEEMTKLDEDRTDTTGIPEAEPRDGWAAYNSYLLNNLRMPQDASVQKLHGTVDVSFLVAPNGRLSDFRIEKSLSMSCDREAIRLLREGPAWDLYNTDVPLRTRVTVIF
jgi:hypothetical protein